jgi:hypothetical protein
MKDCALKTGKNKTKSRSMVVAGLLIAVAAIAVLTGTEAGAQDDFTKERFQPFEAIGFQPDSTSALVFHGKPIGNSAIWNVKVGPLESTPFATIPSSTYPAAFGGADCRADYSQAEIVAEDDSTLTLTVYGFRCDLPIASTATGSGPHFKSGVYSVVGGTGAFQNVRGGTGSVSFDAPGDGRVFVNITGFIECYPTNPIHGSCQVRQ